MKSMDFTVKILEYPTEREWMEVKRRALVTVGKSPINPPNRKWRKEILEARHSPIRYLRFSFYLEIPYWVSVHLCRHIHAQPYVRSQRNDRQGEYDRNAARQDQTVSMIWDMNVEELMNIANKRLCNKASEETRDVVEMMCTQAEILCSELNGLLVPSCVYNGGECHEMKPCRMFGKEK